MANFVTVLRIVFSIALLFCPAFSSAFYVLYLSAGFTDMKNSQHSFRIYSANKE